VVGTAAGAVGCPHCPVAATSDTDLSCWFLQKIVFFISFCNFVRALERLLFAPSNYVRVVFFGKLKFTGRFRCTCIYTVLSYVISETKVCL